MEKGKRVLDGGRLSAVGVDEARHLMHGLSVHGGSVASCTHPVFLALQSNAPGILKAMREMVSKHTDIQIGMFCIPPSKILRSAVVSTGSIEPSFSVAKIGPFFQVTIYMILGSRRIEVVGEMCESADTAESSAANKALRELSASFRVIDISARKTKALILRGRALYQEGMSGFGKFDSIIWGWKKSLESLALVHGFADKYLKAPNHVVSHFSDAIFCSVLYIMGTCRSQIEPLVDKVNTLRAEKVKYAAASATRSSFASMIPVKKAYFREMEALALCLKWLQLEPCEYSEEIGDNCLYLGAVHISFPDVDKWIFAKHHKKTIEKAHNAAAREAIFYLEELYNFDISGYNHGATVDADQQTFIWKGVKDEIMTIGRSVIRYWGDMVEQIANSINRQKNARDQLIEHPHTVDEMAFVNDLLDRFDIAAAKCSKSFKVAAAKFPLLE